MPVGVWFASADVTDHSGQPVPSDEDFFHPPPSEIGGIISAQSTLRHGYEPTAVSPRRVRMTLLAAAVVAGLWFLLGLANWKPEQLPALRLSGAIAAAVLGLVTWLHQKPRYICTYVGTEGIARFACYGTRDRPTRQDVFLFQDARDLRVRLREIKVNFGYLHTEYAYRWTDAGGRCRFTLRGHHHSEAGRPPRDDGYIFARAAERAWTAYLMPATLHEIGTCGATSFKVGRSGSVEVGPGLLRLNGKELVLEQTRLLIRNGVVTLRVDTRRRAPLLRHKSYKFKCGDISNLRLLLAVVDYYFGSECQNIASPAVAGYHVLHP